MNIEWCLMINICLNPALCNFKGMKDKYCLRMMMNLLSLFSLHYYLLHSHSVSLPTLHLLYCLSNMFLKLKEKYQTKDPLMRHHFPSALLLNWIVVVHSLTAWNMYNITYHPFLIIVCSISGSATVNTRSGSTAACWQRPRYWWRTHCRGSESTKTGRWWRRQCRRRRER